MNKITMRYITASMDVQPEGLNFQMFWSPVRPHPIDLISYPNTYTYMGETCTWLIFSATELTAKVVSMIGEQADIICIAGQKSAANRKAVNR